MMMRKFVMSAVLALGVLAVPVAVLLPATASAEKFSAAVGKPLQAAQEEIKKKRWDAAMVKLKEAQAVPTKTPFEEYSINEMMAYVLLKTGDNAGAAKLYEANLNSGQTPADQVPTRVKTLAQLYMQNKNYPKAIEYGNRWIKQSPGETDAYVVVAQSYFQTQDCKNSVRTMQNGIDAARKANQPVKENWLQLKLFCQDKLKDKEGVAETREQLVRSYPSQQHWDDLLTTVYDLPDNDDLTRLSYYRLMYDVNVLKKSSDYVEYAQMALENGAPGEAQNVVQKGFANKVLDANPKEKERNERLLKNAQTQAATNQSQLVSLDTQAKAAATGEQDVGVGIAYYSFGKFDKAVEALQRGLQKGAGKRTAEGQIMLGRAYLALKQKDNARKAFKSVADDSKLARVAELYDIYAAQS